MINYDFLFDYDNVDDSYRQCVQDILFLKGHKKYYIGATNNPDMRLQEHENDKDMHNMFVLCRVFTLAKAKLLETKLIHRFDNKESMNQSGGGEGLTEGINYIYILFK